MTEVERHYDRVYQVPNYFGYKAILYRRYVAALLKKVGLPAGAALLDVPCGQGFFSFLFSGFGLKVCGMDISEEAVLAARRNYGSRQVRFHRQDVRRLRCHEEFDCVFSRSCSLHNTGDFADDPAITESMLRCLKPGGVLIFAYNTNLGAFRNERGWHNHTLQDVRRHFASIAGRHSGPYLVSKLDTLLLGRFVFNGFITALNLLLIKISGLNGDIVYWCSKDQTGG